jgi:hypothetical protein
VARKTIKTVRPDNKGRITLGELLKDASSVRVTLEDDGKIVLEPYTEIPLREAWLYDNPDALQRVRTGLSQAAEGKNEYRGDFSTYLNEEEAE